MRSIFALTIISFALLESHLNSAANILFLCPASSRSHMTIGDVILKELARKNHSVTVVSSYKTDIPQARNIIIQDGFDFFAKMNPIETRRMGVLGVLDVKGFSQIVQACEATYQNQDFIRLLNETFDLVIMDAFLNHCLQGFIYKLKPKPPVIWTMPMPAPNFFMKKFGGYSPPSFVVDRLGFYTREMTLFQRLLNPIMPSLTFMYYHTFYPEFEEIYRKYLKDDDIPEIDVLEKDLSMMLTNSHFSINSPMPVMPDIVEIGGVHCRAGKPLPKELAEFADGAKEGLILLSLGSTFPDRDLPESTRRAFVQAFSQLKQRVLWKWDHVEMADLPPNVKTAKWLPLQDLLAHPNTKLFLTHGGILSTQEAIYHGVPIIGIPIFSDQDVNVANYVDIGIAVKVEILGMTVEHIAAAMNEVLFNSKYGENVQKLSALFRDQPQSPLDRAVFWSEYVMRHRGAPELRSVARKLNYVQYHYLDVMAIVISILIGAAALISILLLRIYRKLVSKVASPPGKKDS